MSVGDYAQVERDAEDARRYRWLKAEDRKAMPLGTISWRQQGNGLPCKLANVDDLDSLIDLAMKYPTATVQEIYELATNKLAKGHRTNNE